jgi:glycine cleavage system transcriptional repressor
VTLYAVNAVGVDRPGVVAAVTGVLVERGCNLEDTQMAVLRGYAAMMLVVRAPEPLAAEMLQSALAAATDPFGFTISVQPIDEVVPEDVATDQPTSRWSVSVRGADRPGIVFEVTRLLALTGINIVNLHTRLRGRDYTLSMDVTAPAETDGEQVAAELDRLAARLGVACSMRPAPPSAETPERP